jgi:hypothetical protein
MRVQECQPWTPSTQSPSVRPPRPLACAENELVQRRLALYHSVVALYMRFSHQAEETFDRWAWLLTGRSRKLPDTWPLQPCRGGSALA